MFNLWTMNYLNAMNDILSCGVAGEVDSKYGKDYYDSTFLPIYTEMMDFAGTFDLMWHPGIHYSFFAVWIWWWCVICFWVYMFWFGWWFWGGIFWWNAIFFGWWGWFWIFEIFYWFWFWVLNYIFYALAYGLPQMLVAGAWGTWWTEKGGQLLAAGGGGDDEE